MNAARPLDALQHLDQFPVRQHPTDANARKQHLGEAPQVHHPVPLPCHRDQRGNMGTRVPQLLIKAVLNDRYAVAAKQLQQGQPFLGGRHDAGRIVVGRH
ncbi:hypothetical protein D3C74_460080 [compost metagenome]